MPIQEDSNRSFLYKIRNNSAYEWDISLISSSYKERHADRQMPRYSPLMICIPIDSLGYVRMNTC